MTFRINPETTVSHVTLRVHNLVTMTNFYTQIIGLIVLQQTSKIATLTIPGDEQPRLTLKQGYDTVRNLHTTGLYHTAWIQPTRRDLANTLQHYQQHHIPVFLAADHRFSQSLYVWDPEMNAVEVYYDFPRKDWLILPDGRMPQRTIPLDTKALLREADNQWRGLAFGSRLGHIHLRVSVLKTSTHFYNQILGFDLKDWLVPHASFLAADGYHHHIALNDWHGPYPNMSQNQTGLMDFSINVGTRDAWLNLRQQLVNQAWPFDQTEELIQLSDPDQNKLNFVYFDET
ncbi:VOC family protein [Furfurilactobacillus cerevisiae]|uniref:VOC family protein n=1 Tax=Furfurilactobacillus rossiae TaxID=231049 RepID=UPI003B986A3A